MEVEGELEEAWEELLSLPPHPVIAMPAHERQARKVSHHLAITALD